MKKGKNILENGISFPLFKGSCCTKLQVKDKFCNFLFYQRNKALLLFYINLLAQINNVKLVVKRYSQLTYQSVVCVTRNEQNLILNDINSLLCCWFCIVATTAEVIAPVINCIVIFFSNVVDYITYFINILFNITIR